MNNLDLKNRVAIITGGAQGFGLAISKRIIQSGGKIVIWDIDKVAAESALKEINSKNSSYKIVDVTNFKEIEKALKEVESELGKIDIFVNPRKITSCKIDAFMNSGKNMFYNQINKISNIN